MDTGAARLSGRAARVARSLALERNTGAVVGAMATGRDITERYLAERAKRAAG